MLAIIFKSIFNIFSFDFTLHIFLLSISYMGLLEREENYSMIFDIPILLCLSTQMLLTSHFCYAKKHIYVIHDWRKTVVRWLLMHFSQDFLVILVKKSDMSVKYNRQLNLTHHKQEP